MLTPSLGVSLLDEGADTAGLLGCSESTDAGKEGADPMNKCEEHTTSSK